MTKTEAEITTEIEEAMNTIEREAGKNVTVDIVQSVMIAVQSVTIAVHHGETRRKVQEIVEIGGHVVETMINTRI